MIRATHGPGRALLATLALWPALSHAEAPGWSLLSRNYFLHSDFRSPSGSGQNYRQEWAQGFIGEVRSGFTEGTVGVGIDAPAPESESLLARRHKSFAKPQKNYYADPPQIERGWKEHLFDVKGRAYLDMVNNVTILGHGHPKLAAAASLMCMYV